MEEHSGSFTAALQATPFLLVRPSESIDYSLSGTLTGSVLLEGADTTTSPVRTIRSLASSVEGTYTNQTDRDVYVRMRVKTIGGAETVTWTIEEQSGDQQQEGFRNSSGDLVAEVTDEGFRARTFKGDGVEYNDDHSFQVIEADLNIGAAAGNVKTNPKFISPVMGNLIGDTPTKEGAYLAGVIGALSVLNAIASLYGSAGLIGMLTDGVTDADAIVLAMIDGSDPSASTRARAAFGVQVNNNHASSGVDYGVDLKSQVHDGLTGNTKQLAIAKALSRSPNNVVVMEGDGAPSSGASGTGDNFAGPGSQYIDYTNANLYIQVGAITSPSWKLVTRAA